MEDPGLFDHLQNYFQQLNASNFVSLSLGLIWRIEMSKKNGAK